MSYLLYSKLRNIRWTFAGWFCTKLNYLATTSRQLLMQSKSYSTSVCPSSPTVRLNTKKKKLCLFYPIHPYFMTGFFDAAWLVVSILVLQQIRPEK